MDRPGERSNERTRDVMGTFALYAVRFMLGGVLVTAFVWSMPAAVHLLLR